MLPETIWGLLGLCVLALALDPLFVAIDRRRNARKQMEEWREYESEN